MNSLQIYKRAERFKEKLCSHCVQYDLCWVRGHLFTIKGIIEDVQYAYKSKEEKTINNLIEYKCPSFKRK